MKSSEALRKARQLIEDDQEHYLCLALRRAGVNTP